MTIEKITIMGKRKKQLKTLAVLLGDVGFNYLEYEKNRLIVGHMCEDLHGNLCNDYTILFDEKSIEFSYAIKEKESTLSKKLEVLPLFFNVLILSKSHYEVDPTPLFKLVIDLLEDLKGSLNKETVDVVGELNELKEKYAVLLKKYEEIVRASEENARLLLEAEQRYHELSARIQQLEALSDETLKEELYEWIKVHGGAIDISEFAKAYSLPYTRVEEGLEMLMREGYIKRRFR